MISQNPHSNCTSARLYYYDFLSERTRQGIPETALYHIKLCHDCQAEIERLEILLAHADENAGSEQHRRDSAVSTLLKLHFAYAEEPVTCGMVKPFLASLADPVLKLRVSTPITLHIDKCRACSSDLRVLRDLRLTHKQLCHLGQLLAAEPAESTEMCSKARTAIPAVVSMVFRETNAETLKHLCICPECRKHLYRRREAVRQKLLRDGAPQGEFPCEAISASDIHDYALPYGIDPADDQYAEFRGGLTSHVGACPECLAKVQGLHRIISDIAERTESDVVTVYHLDESARDEGRGTTDDRRATVDFVAHLKRKVSGLKTKSLVRAGLAAAAVILIGLGLFLYSSSAAAVSLKQIYSAVEGVRNVHITTSIDQQEQWVSQGLNIYLMKIGPEWVLFDVGTGVRKSKDSLTGKTDQRQLPEDEIESIKKKMNITLALMPFDSIYGIPPGTQWSPVMDAAPQSASGGTEMYDLTWTERTSSNVARRWRFYVDPGTRLPHKIESYQKRSVDTDYRLRLVKQVEYLSDAEMKAVIGKVFP
jgi:hypothetical protein